MNSQQGKDTALAYLKVVIHLLNENIEELDFKIGRPLRLDDLDNLSSTHMLKIVTYLLRDVFGDKPISKPSALREFNKYGVGNVTYDSGIDHIYHAVKSIFPEDSDLFHYSVLLLPSANPKRTKAVISYIMSFVLMCDNLEERFSTAFNEILAENDLKVGLCSDIDELKDKISEKIQEKETERERLPSLQQELQNLEANIQKQQRLLGKLNTEMEKHKAKYEGKEAEVKKFEQQLECISMECLALEQQIVPNPNDIRIENASIKKQLETEAKTRETIGLELKKYAKDCDDFEALIQRAQHVLRSIEAVIVVSEDLKLNLEAYMETEKEIGSSYRKLDRQRQSSQDVKERHAEKLKEVDRVKREFEFQIEGMKKEICKKQEEITQTKDRLNTLTKTKNEINQQTFKISQEIEKLKGEITTYCHCKHHQIPQLRSQTDAEAVQFLEKVKESFGNYPFISSDKPSNAG